MQKAFSHQCPLCGQTNDIPPAKPEIKEFVVCICCSLAFIPERFHLSQGEEIKRYALHENTADNPSYMKYLTDIADDSLRFFPGVAKNALDFGSGENHVLTDILKRKGISCVAHDPAYGLTVAQGRFDIVMAIEVFEHFRDPAKEIALISRLVKPGGVVYVRTRLCDDVVDFGAWWYARDMTHICFYSIKTMQKIAAIMGKNLAWTNNKDIVVFT